VCDNRATAQNIWWPGLGSGPAGSAHHASSSAPEFQALRTIMESDWTLQMMKLQDVDTGSLPIIWDADFLYGPRDTSAAPRPRRPAPPDTHEPHA
jgi:hypothetical protein